MHARELSLIAGMAAVTFLVRYGFYALGERLTFPPMVHRALRYVPVAVLTAITVPMVLLPDGSHWRLDWHNAWLAGVLATGAIVWFWDNLLGAIGGGMLVYFVYRWIAG